MEPNSTSQQSVQNVIDDQIRNFANVSGSDEKMQQTYGAQNITFSEKSYNLLVMAISSKTSQSHQRQKDEIN
jgi:hypothetical protein